MESKSWKDFHRDLRWSTRIYTLATILVIALAAFFRAWDTNFAMTIVGALAVILFVESFALSFQRHPRLWMVIRWVLLLALLALLLIGFRTILFSETG